MNPERIRTVIVDDEVAGTEVFALELDMYCPGIEVVATCNDAREAPEVIASARPELLFLDIEMPFMNGFEMLEKTDTSQFETIFVTAYDAFAVKAFKYSAAHYLLKPVNPCELKRAVSEVEARLSKRKRADHMEALLSNINFLNLNIPKIAFPTYEGVEFVEIENIRYCEADGSYAVIHLTDGKKILQSKSLKQVELMLEGHRFLRIHQSYLINLNHLKRYVRGQGGTVVMSGGKELPVSRSKKDGLMDAATMK